MRQTILAAAVAFVIGGAATGAVLTHAQPAPPPPGPPGAPAGAKGGPPEAHGWMGWGHHMRPGMGGGPWGHGPMRRAMEGPAGGPVGGPVGGMRAFALLYRQADRALSPADVQKIAEAFLLWNGNHTWKIVDVGSTSDGSVAFSVATQSGSVVAKFTMDPHTARVMRVG